MADPSPVRVSLRRYKAAEALYQHERKISQALAELYQVTDTLCSLYMRQVSSEELCDDAWFHLRSEIQRLDPQRIALLRRVEELETQRHLQEQHLREAFEESHINRVRDS